MAIYLSRKKGGTVATPITPSNSSPAQMTADTPVNPTGNGYAIESYSSITPSNSSPATITSGSIYKASSNGKAVASVTNVTPSSTPTSVSANDVVKIGGSGVIVDSIPTPTSLTPSNSSPATITSGETYTATASGKAIESFYTITPSDVTPLSLTSGNIYKMSGSGKAVASVTSKTPSDSSPASIPGGTIIKASSSGYLYSSSGLGKCKAGAFTTITTGSQTINLGFQPKYIMVMSEGRTINIYDYSYSSTKAVYATTSTYPTEYTISGNTSNNRISAITSTGFTFNKSGTAGATEYYFAMA